MPSLHGWDKPTVDTLSAGSRMPLKAPRQCTDHGCPSLAHPSGHGRCAQHMADAARLFRTNDKRERGYGLERKRRRLFWKQPLCALCPPDTARPSVIRDHILPLADGGLDIEANTQGLCKGCHDRKTAEELRRRNAWKAWA